MNLKNFNIQPNSDLCPIQIILSTKTKEPISNQQKTSLELTVWAEAGSFFGIAKDRQPMLQNLLGTPDLELPDQAEELPSPSSSIVHLALQVSQLGLLRLGHHFHQSRGYTAKKTNGF